MTYDSFRRNHKYEKNLTDAELISLNELANSPDMLILKANKGNTVVICDKKLDVDKMNGLKRIKRINVPIVKELNY